MSRIQFGILAIDYQVIDVVGPTDLLSCASKELLSDMQQVSPIDKSIIDRAPQYDFHHIGITRDPVLLTSSMSIVPTTTVDECPELDILLVGGPDPLKFELHPKFAELVRRHVAAGKLLFTNCTGASVVAGTGVLDGKKATVNNVAFEYAKKRYPNVKWTREKQWVVDGNIWTGSGAVAGMDMVAHWLKENYGLDILTLAASLLDYEPRDIDGLLNVIPKRYNANGEQISTHTYSYH
ncbi:class I glutamine amidotransferase-like protein [Trichoderma chlorosporum]